MTNNKQNSREMIPDPLPGHTPETPDFKPPIRPIADLDRVNAWDGAWNGKCDEITEAGVYKALPLIETPYDFFN